jgi:hypothetical protein
MSAKVLKYLLLCLAIIAGCNKVAFIEDEDRFKISENDIFIPDIGDTRHISLNKEDWIIESVEMSDSIGHHFLGNINENGHILTSTRMQMKGLGEIWTETTYGGFRITREEYDALTVHMGPNLTYRERNLKIILRSGVETIELNCIQQPSQGYVIDRIEWDETVSAPIFSVHFGIGHNFLYKGRDFKGFYQIIALKTHITRRLYIHTGYQFRDFNNPDNLLLGLGWRFINSKK